MLRNTLKTMALISALAVAGVLAPAPVAADTAMQVGVVQFGNIRGTVRNAGGFLVPNATVYLFDASGNTVGKKQSNFLGQFTFTNIPAGLYNVEVKAGALTGSETVNVMANQTSDVVVVVS